MPEDIDFIDAVLRKCSALQASGLWPPEPHVRPKAWLYSFPEGERILGAVLLDNFTLFSDRAVDNIFRAAYRDAIAQLYREDPAESSRVGTSGVFTPVEGETPSPTDSGFAFCRRARQVLAVEESRILLPAEALKLAIRGSPIVFVDDFIGSGDQLIDTWNRPYSKDAPHSFAEAHRACAFKAISICLAATSYGLNKIAQSGIPVMVVAAHTLSAKHSVRQIHYEQQGPSVADLASTVEDLLSSHASELRLADYMKPSPHCTHGYHGLGLMLGFEHSIPDASLPIYWADSKVQDWVPLRRRT